MVATVARCGASLRDFVRRNCVLGLALAPLLRLLLVHDFSGEFSALEQFERNFWIITWLAEIVVIVSRPGSGLDIARMLSAVPRTAQVLVSLWAVALFASTLHAEPFPILALLGTAEWLLHLLFGVAVWQVLSAEGKSAASFLKFARVYPFVTMVIGLIVIAIVCVVETQGEQDWSQFLPGFANIRHTGYLYAPAMAIGLGMLSRPGPLDGRVLGVFVINVALCLWFGSRGPVFGLACAFVGCWMLFDRFRTRKFLIRAGAGMLGGTLVSLLVPSPNIRYFNAILRLFYNLRADKDLSTGRFKFWSETIAQVSDAPIFGHGLRQFQFTVEIANKTYKHPHNSVVQVLFDWGVIGGLAFVGLVGLLAWNAVRPGAQSLDAYRIAILGLLTMLAFSLLDGILFYPQTIAVTLIFAIAALVLGHQGRRPLPEA